ncbi:secreted RxLR effector protein 161-like [Cannabis sativa]|uniref:secreted RxLR effector protein 161-like n=1 Tax=Cannabis sativa TaxID=3483 RepID=UPI0029C9CBBA|nr:secreted RxLR effector protein 161-like [Cannabis sativa]
MGIFYNNQIETAEEVVGYGDSDYAANIHTRRSLTRLVFTVFGGAVIWKSNLQKVVALSTTEAEYMAAAEAFKEALWLKGLTAELGLNSNNITIYCANQSALHLI